MVNYQNHLILRKEFVKVVPSHQFCLTCSLMIFLIIVNKYGISIGDKRCCGGLFADDIVLCAPTRSQLKKLLKFASKWNRNNEMQFGINKCASLVRGEFSSFLFNSNPTFYLSSQELPKTNCYTYLGVPFSNDLELKPIIQWMNNKVRKALYPIKGFLKNPRIPIPYKRMLFSAIVIG